MIKRMILMLLGVFIIIGGILGFKLAMATGTKKFLSSMGEPPQTVSTLQAVKQDWAQETSAVGSLRAVNGVDLSAEVGGIVDTLSFDSGVDVEKDAVLVHLRDADDVARLHALDATLVLAQTTLDRDQKLLKTQAVSQATVDADIAALQNAKAQKDAQQALINKKTIRAPFAGHLGLRQVDMGQYLNAGAPLVTLQQLDPIYVDFNLPEQISAKLSAGQKVTAHVESSVDDLVFEGEISAINAKVDEATRNIQVRATLKNPDHKLLPGMFARVAITTGAPQSRVTLPQTAITYNPYGNTIFLVGKNEQGKPVARQTFVTVGPVRGDQIAILSGVNEGDEVISGGQLKLHNGTPLLINNEIQPKNDPAPKPADR